MAPRDRLFTLNKSFQCGKIRLHLFRDVLRASRSKQPSTLDSTPIRRTMKPFAPMPSSAWLRCPNMRSKPPTKWLRKVPRPFRSFVARRRRASGMISRHAAVDVRCPKVVARPRPMNRCDPFDPRRRCRGQRACQLDACRPDPGLTVPVDDVLEKQEDGSSSVDERRELHLLAYRSFE